SSSSWKVGAVPNVRVIGEKQIEKMSLLADRALQKAKRISVPIFSGAGLLLIVAILLLQL
ncbi:hypothetical protein KAS06_04185, partial [Candidatus Bathyarchaeota archaeon]|nr:hypothetical protein [Candidatus Bathyarchaeota archaeon]